MDFPAALARVLPGDQKRACFTCRHKWLVPWLEGSEGTRQGHPPPLLLLQFMVSDLLALQVQLGVLQLRCESLALLLELLQCPLALVTVCLQVPKLEVERWVHGQQPPRVQKWRAGSVTSSEPKGCCPEGRS